MKELTQRVLVLCALFSVVVFQVSPASGQTYPDKPVRIVVGFSPGGFTDVLTRMIAQRLQERLGQPFVVENKPGAAGTIGAGFVARSKPDGYTLLMGVANSNSIAPALYPKLPYDVNKDFTPIIRMALLPFMLTVHPSVPANDVPTFIKYAKTTHLRFASSGQGSGQHLAAEQFMLQTGITMTHVPYKGSGQAITDLLSGNLELNFESPPNTLQYIKTGRLKALGITSADRSPLLPDVPTIAEQGLPGYEIIQWLGVLGPAGMPKVVVDRLNHEIDEIIRTPEFAEKIASQGGTVQGGSPEAFASYIRSDTARWEKLIKAANIKLE